jgi:ABC-type hemin transport system substrate-binding protein
MSFTLHKTPQVEPSATAQLELKIEQARKTMTPHELIDHVIKLYGVEFEKANAMIASLQASLKQSGELLVEQKRANDELFRIKQKVVIVNRELLKRIQAAAEAKGVWRVISEGGSAVIMCGDHKIADDLTTETAEWICAEHHAALFSHTSVVDIEAHRVQAEDTPA